MLEVVRKNFPGKHYVGLDLKLNFIAVAKSRVGQNPDLEFICGDVYTYSAEPYDFIFARALLQHLPDLPKFLGNARKLLKPAAKLLVIRHGSPSA